MIPLGLTVAASATDAAIQKKTYGMRMNNDWNNETIRKALLQQQGGSLAMLIGTLVPVY